MSLMLCVLSQLEPQTRDGGGARARMGGGVGGGCDDAGGGVNHPGEPRRGYSDVRGGMAIGRRTYFQNSTEHTNLTRPMF